MDLLKVIDAAFNRRGVDHFIAGAGAVTVRMVTGTGTDGEKLSDRGCGPYPFQDDEILNQDTFRRSSSNATE